MIIASPQGFLLHHDNAMLRAIPHAGHALTRRDRSATMAGGGVRVLRLVPLALFLAAVAAAAQPATAPAGWLFDEITLVNGAKFQGLLMEESPREVRFKTVKRRPGQPTFTLTWKAPRADIASIKKLSDADRTILKARIAELDQDGSGERKRIQALDLVPATWLGEPDKGKLYRSECFTLVSD